MLEAGLDLSTGQPPGTLELLLSTVDGRIDSSVLTKEQEPFMRESSVALATFR